MDIDKQQHHVIMPGQDVEVDLFRPDDAYGVSRLFRAVYGDGYPLKIYCVPEQLIAGNDSRRMVSTVARTPNGEVVGHVALFRSAAYEKLYQSGEGVILPGYRKKGLIRMLFEHSYHIGPNHFDIEAIFGEAVCNHTFMQRTAVGLGHQETALEVDLMPSSAYTHEKSATGRVASLLMFGEVRHRPQTVCLPDAYRETLGLMYGWLSHKRTVVAPASQRGLRLPTDIATRANERISESAQVIKVAVHQIGSDFENFIDNIESRNQHKGMKVFQVWLKVDTPWVGGAVDILRSKGYFLGGILPRCFDHDGLLMQKIIGQPNWAEIKIYSDWGQKILELVRDDWALTRQA